MVKTKGRRKIIVADKMYIWYVKLDYDSPYHILSIVSSDKTLIIHCPLEINKAYVISEGNKFQNKKTNGIWNRYLLLLNVPEIITPKFVADIILWATQSEKAVEIKWNGKDVPV